ncbi:2511_t:CDS:2 [Scutellospora calospora]|uniref:2511_t:CDS:1 n=1 Tax=Scutellospora calospora TaxID=85575 RepID=A0ACA9KBR4_9GLOM|nr:2511_t:CDS:2 [Scutellospora calospora]
MLRFAQEINNTIDAPIEEINVTIATPYSEVFEETYVDSTLDFIVLGDWGYKANGTGRKHGDQVHVAFAMDSWAKKYNTNFIVNVGDSFYKNGKKDHQGVKSVNDSKWKTNWLDVYKGKLSDIPWYSHTHVLEYQYPKPSSPIAIFTSGAGSRSSGGCEGKDWGMPEGTLGFLHAKIESNSDKMSFEFVDATTYKAKIVYQGYINSTSIWYPKKDK